MDRFRNSQLELRRQCGFAYERTYIAGDEGLPSPSLLRGGNLHAAVAAVVRSLMRTGAVDVHAITYQLVRGGAAEYADALELVTRVQEQLGVEIQIDLDRAFLLEDLLEMPLTLRDGTEVTFYGTPDLVVRLNRHACEIDDWKTHWNPESEAEFRAGQQLPRYALLVHHHHPHFTRFRLRKWFVRWRGNAPSMEITAEDLHQVRERLISEIEAERAQRAAGAFEATPGSWCAVCRHATSCPRVLEYREKGIDDVSIPDDERARQLAGDAIALAAARAMILEPLKAYLGGEHPTGSVPVSGGEYGYSPVEKREIDPRQLRETLERLGLEVPDYLFQVDLAALDRFCKRLPENAVKAIEKVTRTWQTSECRFRRSTAPQAIPTAAPAAAAGELF